MLIDAVAGRVLLVGLLLGGCGSVGTTTYPASEPKSPDSIPMVRRSAWSLDANHQGRLAVRRNCLVIESPNELHVVVWPSPGAEWDPVAGVVTFDGISAWVGDEVVLSGGETQLPGAPGGYDWVSGPTAGCLTYPVGWLATRLEVVPGSP